MMIIRRNSMLASAVRIAAIALFTGFIMYFPIARILLSDLENSLIRFAEQGATTVDAFVSGRLSEARLIAANGIISNSKLPLDQRLTELQEQLKLDEYIRISIADLDGNTVTNNGTKLYIGDRDYFKEALAGALYVSDPMVSRIDNTIVIIFSVPILEKDKTVGVLNAVYDAGVLSQMTDKIKLGDGGHAFILNSSGSVIAHADRRHVYNTDYDLSNISGNKELKQLVQLERKMIAGEKGTGSYYVNGEKRHMGFCPIGDTGWSIAVTAPKNLVFGAFTKVLIILTILILAASLVIAFIFTRSRSLEKDLLKQRVDSYRVADFTNLIALAIERDGTIVSTNRYADDLLLYFDRFAEEKIQNIYELLSAEDCVKLTGIIAGSRLQNSSTSFDIALKRGESKTTYIYCIAVSESENSDYLEILGIDISERVEQEKKLQDSYKKLTTVYEELAASEETIRRLAYKDSLTGLPNRAALYNEIGKVINAANKTDLCAVICLDLDNYKYINDSFGHTTGDKLLIGIGRRLREACSAKDFVARFEGDEFIVFIKKANTIEEIYNRAEIATGIFNTPFTLLGNNIYITVSCGISIYPKHASNIEDLMKSSYMAMHKAKKEGKNKPVLFKYEMNDEFTEHINMENGLRDAIDKNEFILHYQPQIDLDTGKVSGFEALIRWAHSERGLIAPLKFINFAEETGLIVEIGKWVLKEACQFIKKLNDATQSRLGISVNISVIQLMQADFVNVVTDILKNADLDPALLELEITESKLLETVEMNLQKLYELRKIGLRLSIDDFGKGFSSLSYLKQLPIDTLKIDKSFIDDIPEEGSSIIESIIHIGHQRNLTVVAEGVERLEQMEFLVRHKCDKVQGYFYSEPVPEHDAGRLVTDGAFMLP